MSRPVPSDLPENEQPIQAAQSPAIKYLSSSVQEARQAQTLPQVPQAVSDQSEPTPQGPLPASQGHLRWPRQLWDGPEPKPEQENGEQREQQQHGFGEAFTSLSPLPLGSRLSYANVHERGATPSRHIPGTSSLVDPPLSAANSSTQLVVSFPGSQHSSQVTPACHKLQNPLSPSYYRAPQRETDCSTDLNVSDIFRQREQNERSSRKRSRSSYGRCPKSSRKSKTYIKNSSGGDTRKGSECDFQKSSEFFLTGECESYERKSPNFCAEKSSRATGQMHSKRAASEGPRSTAQELDSSEISYTAHSQNKRKGLCSSASAISPERIQERASSPIRPSLTAPDETDGCKPSHIRTSPLTSRKGKSSNSTETLHSPHSRGEEKSQDTGSRLTGSTPSSDGDQARFCPQSRRAKKRKKTGKRRCTTRQQRLKWREVPHETHAQVCSPSHQHKQGCSPSSHFLSHSPTLPRGTSLTMPPILHQNPACGSECASDILQDQTRKGRNQDRPMGSKRQSRNRGWRNNGEDGEGNEKVSSGLTTELATASKPSPCPQSSCVPESDQTTVQPEGAGVFKKTVDKHHSPDPVQIKSEAVDEEYPPVANLDIQDLAKPEPAVNAPCSDNRNLATANDRQKSHSKDTPRTPGTTKTWSILSETPVSYSSCSSSFETSSDKDTKERICREMEMEKYYKDVNKNTDKDSKEEIGREMENRVYTHVKEDSDNNTKDGNDFKDVKDNVDGDRLQAISNNSTNHWFDNMKEKMSSGEQLKSFKDELGDEVKREEDGYESLTEVTPTFIESSLQTVQPLSLPSGSRTSRNQQRRKQKTPRQIRKQCVLQSTHLSKNESVQTDGDGDKIVQEGVILTDYSGDLKKNCHPHYQPGCKSYMSQVCMDVPKSLALAQSESKDQQSKYLTHIDINDARSFPRTVLGGDNLLNLKNLQILGNPARGLNVTSHISHAGTVSSNQGAFVVSTTSIDSKMYGPQPVDYRSQILRLNRQDAIHKQKNSPKDPIQPSSAQTVLQSTVVMPTPATPFSLVRLPYIPVPVHCPTLPAVFPSLSKHHIHPSTSLSLGTSVGLAHSPKTAHLPTYIPIVPKMSSMMPVVPTKLSVSGISQTMSSVARGEASSGTCQSIRNAYNTVPNAASVLNVQQHHSGEANGAMMQGVPQLGIVRNPMISTCAGGIPVLIFLPSLGQDVPVTQVTSAQFMTADATAKISPEQQGPKSTKITCDQVSVKDVHDDAKNSDDQKLESHQHEVAKSTKAYSSKGESIPRTDFGPSTEADSSKEVNSKTSEMLPACTLSLSSENAISTSAKASFSENRTEVSNTVTSASGKPAKTTSQGSMTYSFPFHYDACKRAEEIVFSTTSNFLPQLDAKNAWEKNIAGTSTDLPQINENSQISTQKLSTEILKPAGMSKSGRKRVASTRYDFHSDIELSDASEKEDITPMTSDDEWIPEKDCDGQSSPSSEGEDSHTQLRRRDSLVDLFRQSRNKKFTKSGHGSNVKKQRRDPAPCSNHTVYLWSQKQPQEQTQNIAKLQSPEHDQAELKQQTPADHNLDKKSMDPKNLPEEEERGCKSDETSTVTSRTPPQTTPVLKKRRKTPYTKEELTCRLCSKTFINIYRLKRHEFSHGNERPYVCDQCGKAFKQSGHRNEHRLTHNVNKRSFLCNECGVVISSRSSFRYHLLSHKQLVPGSVSTAGCEVTDPGAQDHSDSASQGSGSEAPHRRGTEGPEQSAVLLGMETQTNQLRTCMAAAYDCPHCILRFATAQSLNCHLESHKEVELRCHVQPFTCGECGRSFTYRHNLEKHHGCHVKPEKRAEIYQRQVQAAIAAGKPHFVCDTCGKVYLRKETLTKHMKTHLGLKPYQCTECQKSFTQKIHLTVHSRLHTGSRPFQCRTCRCCFLDSTALARHVMRDVCKSEGFCFNVGKRGRKPFHMVMDEKVKAIVKSNRERRQRKGPASLRCGLCSWTGRYEGFLRRHVQRRHPTQTHKAFKESTKPSSTQKKKDVTMPSTSLTSAASEDETSCHQNGSQSQTEEDDTERNTSEKDDTPMNSPEKDYTPMNSPEKDDSAMNTEKNDTQMDTCEKDDTATDTCEKDDATMDTPEKDDATMDTPEKDDATMDTPEKDDATMDTPEKDDATMDTPEKDDATMDTFEKDETTMNTPQNLSLPTDNSPTPAMKPADKESCPFGEES